MGAHLGTSAGTLVPTTTWWLDAPNDRACRNRCNDHAICWGFVWDQPSKQCNFRGGFAADNGWQTYFY
jgi:hypothetical protein